MESRSIQTSKNLLAQGAQESSDLVCAQRYLQECTRLRDELGVLSRDELVPHFLGEGEHNKNFWFDVPSQKKRYVLRVNVVPQPFHKNQVAYEFSALQTLSSSGCCPQPLFLDDTPRAPENGALVISFCEGAPLNYDARRPGDMLCAAHIMADYHAVSLSDSCELYRPENPLQALYDECLSRYEWYKASGFAEQRVRAWLERLIDLVQPALHTRPAEGDCTHVINTETLSSHILIPDESAQAAYAAQQSGTRFSAHPGFFVDWERPIIGEVAQDLAYFVSPTTTFWDSNYLFPPEDVHDFLETYWSAVEGRFAKGAFDERFRAFRMMTILRSTTWCARAAAQMQAHPGAHMTEKTKGKIATYLSDDFLWRMVRECFLHEEYAL